MKERGIGIGIGIATETGTGNMTVRGIRTVNERGERSPETERGIGNVSVIGIAPPGVMAILVLVLEWAVPTEEVKVDEGEDEELPVTVLTMSIGRWQKDWGCETSVGQSLMNYPPHELFCFSRKDHAIMNMVYLVWVLTLYSSSTFLIAWTVVFLAYRVAVISLC